jgi:uncharacterized RDD family membrane protein YckC
MPQGGGSGQPWETGPQAGAAGASGPGGAPGQGGAPGYNSMSGQGPAMGAQQGQQQYGSPPQGGGPGQPAGGPMQGRPISPVNEIETRVTGRRFVQWVIDYVIVGVIASLLGWALNRGTGATHAVLIVVLVVVDLAWAFWYWVYRPYQNNGQTFGMQVMGIRVISRDGGRASMMQLLIRAVLLIIDELIVFLVGFVTIMLSRYRQRIGDHVAKTLVVKASVEPIAAQQQFAGAGQAGSR